MANPPSNYQLPPGLACQRCGRHDETLRLVSYPFVYSFLLYTLHGEFKGRWCRRHALPHMLLAGLITATAGLLGLPGLYYVPLTLLQLAKGGKIHKANNAKHLRSLAIAKQERGDTLGALRCLEASFKFLDDLWSRQELLNTYTLIAPADRLRARRWARQILWVVALLASAALVGLGLGLLNFFWDDYLFGEVFWQLSGLASFCGWLPLFGLGVPAILCFRQFQETTLDDLHFSHPIPGLSLVLASTFWLSAGLWGGRAIGDFLKISLQGATLPPLRELAVILSAVMLRGGAWAVWDSLTDDSLALLRIVFFGLLMLFALVTFLIAAGSTLAWRRQLVALERPSAPKTFRNSLPGLAALAGLILSLSSPFWPLPQQSLVDFLEARNHYTTAWRLYEDEPEAALAEFQEAIRLDPYMADAYEDLAWVLDDQGETEAAIPQYLKSIEVNPNRASAHFYLAQTYYFAEQKDKAAQEFERAVQLDPDDADTYLGLGWTHYYLGHLDQAETAFQKALALDLDLDDAYIGLGYIYQDRGDIKRQIEIYTQATQQPVAPEGAYTLLGLAYYQQYEFDRAVDNLKIALAQDAGDQLAQVHLASSYLYTGQVDKAIQISQDAIVADPSWVTPHALLASAYIEMNKMDQAREEIAQARAIEAKTDSDRFWLLSALFDAHLFSEAEAEAREGIRRGYSQSDFYLSLAGAYSAQAHYTQAFEACEQARAAGAKLADVLLQQASIYLDQEQPDKSLPLLKQAVALAPEDPAVHHLLSAAYADKEEYALAAQEAQQTVRLNRYHLGGFLQLAFAHLALEHAGEAAQAATRALELAPHADLPHYVLGMVSLQDGYREGAYLEFKAFLAAYRAEGHSQELKEQIEEIYKELKASFELNG